MRKIALSPTPDSRGDEHDVFQSFRRAMDRVFDQFRHTDLSTEHAEMPALQGFALKPDLDVNETESQLDVTVDLPGVREEDIDIQLNGDLLTISGRRDNEKTTDESNYRIVERSSGSFRRTLRLPFEPDSKLVTATLESGVLGLSIAKPVDATAKVRKIEISGKADADSAPSGKPTEASATEPA
jgi:HSP20 family protein